jgi:ABC-2 type transport system ATP-binding protein
MRAGLALALLHRPCVLFLDEPSIGLDVTAAASLREFIAEYAARTQAAVLLTSHYMTEVESLCSRVVLIDHGRLRYDGSLAALTARLSPHKLITVTMSGPAMAVDWDKYGAVERHDSAEPGKVHLEVPRARAPEITARLLAELPITDLSVEEPPLETVMHDFYQAGS